MISGHSAALVFSEQALATTMRIYHVDEKVAARRKGHVSWNNSVLNYDLFLDAPEPTLRAVLPGSVRLSFPLYGHLSTSVRSASFEAHLVVDVFPKVQKDPGGAFRLVMDGSEHIVRQIQVVDLYRAEVTALLGVDPEGPEFVAQLQALLQLAGGITTLLTHDMFSVLEKYGVTVTSIDWRALDGCIAIGMNTRHATGDATRLVDIRRPGHDGVPAPLAGDVAVLLDAEVMSLIVEEQKASIVAAVNQATDGFELADLSLLLDDQGLSIWLKGTAIFDDAPDTDVVITAHATVGLTADRVQVSGPHNVHVTALTADQVMSVLSLFLPLGGRLIGEIIDTAVNARAFNKILIAETIVGDMLGTARSTSFRLPGTSGPRLKLWATAVGMNARGVFVQGTVSIAPAGALDIKGPSVVEVTGAGPRGVSFSQVVGRWLCHPENPNVLLRWELRERQSGALLATRKSKLNDISAALGFSTAIKTVVPGGYVVTLKLIQTSAKHSRTLATARRELPLFYNLDQAKFAQWSHDQEIRPVRVAQAADGSEVRQVQPPRVVRRFSKLHRLDNLRCRFATHISHAALAGGPPHNGVVTLMDKLPFPSTELQARRGEICPYCFFGGPDKTTLLPLP